MTTRAAAYDIYAEFAGYNSSRMNTDGLSSDPSLNKAYYDGIFCSYEMRDFFATAIPYEDYADEYFVAYADYYLRNPGVNYGVPGYWAFGKGLAEHYLRRSSAQALTDLQGLCLHAAYHGVGLTGFYTIEGNFPGTYTVDGHALSREWSYCVMNYIQLGRCQALTAAQEARRDFCFEDLFRIIDWWFTSATASYVRPFMVGILMRALIEYYIHVDTDSRIPTAIGTCLTALIDPNLYIAANKTFYYTDRDGTGEPWGSPDLDRDPDGAPDLNMLIAPAFAWYYQHTSVASWGTYANDLFEGAVPVYSGGFWQSGAFLGTQNDSNPNGKQLNQQLLWQGAYWDWMDSYAPPATATTRSSLVTCLGCGGGPVPEPVASFTASDYGTVIADYDFGDTASVLNGSAVAASNNETVGTVNAVEAKFAAQNGRVDAAAKLAAQAIKDAERARGIIGKLADPEQQARATERLAEAEATAQEAQAKIKERQAKDAGDVATQQADRIKTLDAQIADLQKKAGEISVQVKTDEALGAVANLKAQLAALEDKTVTVTVNTTQTGGGTPAEDYAAYAAAADFRKEGFARGGYTGPGGKWQPAGVVHAGEFVLRQEVVRQRGMLAMLQRLNREGLAALPGFAGGGLVGALQISQARQPAPSTARAAILQFPDMGRFPVTMDADPLGQLEVALARVALQKGGRR